MTNRRQFLNIAATTLFAGRVAPAILGAEDKAGTRLPVLGEGDFQFECHHHWGDVPRHIQWKNTHGVAIDRDGLVYITHQGDAKAPCDTVVVFDSAGTFVRSFGKEFAGGGHGIDIRREDGEEFLYLCDIYNRQVIKCDLQGEWIWKKRYPREPDLYSGLEAFRPTNVCFGLEGELYVADGYGSGFVHQYDADGKWLRTWGGSGAQVGKFETPHGLWLDQRTGREPMIIVADRANARLQYLSPAGLPQEVLQGGSDLADVGQVTTATSADGSEVTVRHVAGVSYPADIDIWEDIMVVADLHARVLLFDAENQLLANLGYDADWTKTVLNSMQVRKDRNLWQPGKFVHPHDACFDQDGNILVTEWVEPGRVTLLKWL